MSKQVRELLESLNVTDGQSIRIDCPFCGGRKTLSVGVKNGAKLYNCFRASCGRAGATKNTRDVRALRSALSAVVSDDGVGDIHPVDTMGFVSASSDPLSVAYMNKWPCLKSINPDPILGPFYDVRRQRLVFPLSYNTDRQLTDAVGRSIVSGVVPKWYRYGNDPGAVFIAKEGGCELGTDVAILVEDCISALAASWAHVGVALLGTNCPKDLGPRLQAIGIKRAIVALDPDAQRKAVDICRNLEYYIPSTVWLIKDDLKYFTKGRLVEGVKQ